MNTYCQSKFASNFWTEVFDHEDLVDPLRIAALES